MKKFTDLICTKQESAVDMILDKIATKTKCSEINQN